jgi:acyl-CoA thioester hydrolase
MSAGAGAVAAGGPGSGGAARSAVVALGVFRTQVQWIDTDASGIYHNTTVARFVESAEAALFAERGIDGYFPVAPRVRYEASFDAPLRFGQQATAIVELVDLGQSSMTFDFEIWGEPFRGRPRTRAAHGRYVTVHVTGQPSDEIRSTPWPDEWVAALMDKGEEPSRDPAQSPR